MSCQRSENVVFLCWRHPIAPFFRKFGDCRVVEERGASLPKKKSHQKTDFGERLKHLRELRSLKVAELAKQINASPAAIWHWEHRGTRPRSGTLNSIAKVLGVSRSFLETGKPVGDGIRNEKGDMPSNSEQMSLEQLMRAIEAKGFEVSVRSKGDARS
jgi:transcriptional regulator with XRE-family HTH domain